MNTVAEEVAAAIAELGDEPADDFTPNAGQAAALEKLDVFLNDPDAFEFGLYGYAGTGKTTVINRAFNSYDGRIAMSAPTHKAVGVLAGMASDAGLPVRVETIHKMLSLKKQYRDGETIFVPDPKRVPMIESYNLLVVDECSMIGNELSELVRPYIAGERIKIVWMGDPLQLPPVGDEADSPTFAAPSQHTLDEVVRNGGIIGDAIAAIRDDITNPDPILARPGADERGRIEVYGNRLWFRKFLEDLQADHSDTIQALAFTNKAVDWINANVRRALFGDDAAPFVEGERLVAVETFEQGGSVAMYTGDQFKVVAAERSSESFVHHSGSFDIPCWELTVDFGGYQDIIPVVDPTQRPELLNRIKEARSAALADRQWWFEYFDLKERFANVRPGYATTVHKSQGSTYDRVYLAQSDVLKSASFDHILRNRLLYVGYSRTRSGLILC